VLEDLALLGVRQPIDAPDMRDDVVERAAGVRVDRGADARAFRAIENMIDADGLDEELERFLVLQHGVEVMPAHAVA
jgi:hypothetical protein